MSVSSLVSFVRTFNAENGGKGCPRPVMIHVGKFSAKVVAEAHDTGALVASVGGKGGSWPAGERPASKVDGVPVTVKARMADALRIIAGGGMIAPTDAAAILADYDAQNDARKGPRKTVDTDAAV